MKVSEEDFVRLTMIGERIAYKVGTQVWPGRIVQYDIETRRASLLYFMDSGPEYQAVGVAYDHGGDREVCWCHFKELTIKHEATEEQTPETEEPAVVSSAAAGIGEDGSEQLQDPVGVSEGDGSAEADNTDAAADS